MNALWYGVYQGTLLWYFLFVANRRVSALKGEQTSTESDPHRRRSRFLLVEGRPPSSTLRIPVFSPYDHA